MFCRNTCRLFALAVLMLVPLSVMGQVQLVIDPQIDQAKVDFDLWNRTIVLIHDSLTMSYCHPQLTIRWNGMSGMRASARTIDLGRYPSNKYDLSEAFYRTLTHEYSHTKFPSCTGANMSWFLVEGLAEAEKNATYQELHRQNPGIKSSAHLFMGDVYDTMPAILGGARVTQLQSREAHYDSVAAKLELYRNLLPGRNFTAFYEAVAQIQPQTENDYLALLDTLARGQKIDGVLPSTFFQESPALFFNGPDETFFALTASRRMRTQHPVWYMTDTPVNPDTVDIKFISRQNGVFTNLIGSLSNWKFEIRDASGSPILSRTNPRDISIPSSLAAGAYTLSGCVLKADGFCDQALQDTGYFPVYKEPNPETGKIFIIANGPEYHQLTAQTQLRLVAPDPRVSTETFPGLLVASLNGITSDITVTDGRRTRVFTPDAELSRILFFTDRDQPYLYTAAHAATFQVGPVVPGSIATLWTWGATHTDPVQSATLPLPTSSCNGGQGVTKVVFTGPDGRSLETPFFYCSQTQLNVQMPWELRGPKAKIRIILNSTSSNEIEVDVVEANAGIFQATWTTPQLGATIFNGGPRDGQLVTPENPARPGDQLATFATGLGPVDNTPATGEAAKADPLSKAVLPVTVQLNGANIQPDFIGLAPGFVGLYQINFQIPTSVNAFPNLQPFRLDMGGRVSKQVMLPISTTE